MAKKSIRKIFIKELHALYASFKKTKKIFITTAVPNFEWSSCKLSWKIRAILGKQNIIMTSLFKFNFCWKLRMTTSFIRTGWCIWYIMIFFLTKNWLDNSGQFFCLRKTDFFRDETSFLNNIEKSMLRSLQVQFPLYFSSKSKFLPKSSLIGSIVNDFYKIMNTYY